MKRALANAARALLGDRFFDLLYWYWFLRVTPPRRSGKPTLLIVNHVFDQDLEALELANDDFSFVVLNAAVLRNVASQIFPTEVERYSAYNRDDLADTKRRYRKILVRFVRRLRERYGIVAVLAPSDNFFYVRELIPALAAVGVPYYVVDKEGTICPAYFTHFAQYIHDQCPLLAEHILVWSERQKEFWKRTGVPSERITVTGQPRSDFWKQPERWRARDALGIPGLRPDVPLLLFFTYDPWAYTPEYMVERGEMHWEKLRAESHARIYAFAAAHPGVDVVIKAHPQQPDVPALESERARHGLPNVHLATGPLLSNHLIVNADCIVGFQSTALIEAMVTDTPIVYTFWGEARDRWADDLIPFHTTTGVAVAESPVAFTALLERYLRQPRISGREREARDRFLEEYLARVDGRSAERTLAAVRSLLAAQTP